MVRAGGLEPPRPLRSLDFKSSASTYSATLASGKDLTIKLYLSKHFYELSKVDLPINLLTNKNCFLVKKVISKYYKKKITFKHPNDLLINKKKICGILQEVIKKSQTKYLVVGIGLNLIKSPKISSYPTTNLLVETNRKISQKKIVKEIKITFEKFLSKYYKTS